MRGGGEPFCKYRFADEGNSNSDRKMTNQRLRFDVDIGGRYLGVGNQVRRRILSTLSSSGAQLPKQNGNVSIFDLDHESAIDMEADGADESGKTVSEFGPKLKFSGHEGSSTRLSSFTTLLIDVSSTTDAVGSVSFHPLHSLLLSVSGSRHFALSSARSPSVCPFSDSDDLEDDSDNDSEGENVNSVKRGVPTPQPFALDTSVKMWLFDDGKHDSQQEIS